MKAGGPEKSSNKHGKASQVAPVVKNLPVNAGDAGDKGLISGLGRSPGEGNGKPLQYSCQGNPMDRGAWQATVHGVAKVRHNLVIEHENEAKNADGVYWSQK